jgi:molybdenum cofactor cytidylyltransferase
MEQIEGILLAAGKSGRFNGFKLGYKLGQDTIIEHSLNGMLSICSKVFVITGFYHNLITEILKGIPRIELVYNENYELGMFTSVQLGAGYISSERFFILPADIPLVSESTYRQMYSIKDSIVIPVFKGKNGHPVLLSKELIPELINFDKYSNLKDFIKTKKCIFPEVQDESILIDIDTPEDYNKIKRSFYEI